MIDLYEELRLLAGALDEAAIPYAICGGIAVSIHAEPRSTVDIAELERGRV